jgi:hypothetical protein
MSNGTLVGSSDGIWTDPPKRQRRFYRECGENTWAPHRGRLCRPLAAAVPLLLFTSYIRGASLVGRNCRIQTCYSVDPLSLVIKCLGGGAQVGGLGRPDYRQTTLSLWRPSQHTHIMSTPRLLQNLHTMS